MEIPEDLLPGPNQYPPFVLNDQDRRRWQLCFALTRLIAQNDDPVFARQLYASDWPTEATATQVVEALENLAA